MRENSKPSVEHLQERINHNPGDAEAYSLLGDALSGQKRWLEAVGVWQEAMRLDPEDDHAQFCIALAITGTEPLVRPSTELLKFLAEHGDGHYLKRVYGVLCG